MICREESECVPPLQLLWLGLQAYLNNPKIGLKINFGCLCLTLIECERAAAQPIGKTPPRLFSFGGVIKLIKEKENEKSACALQ